MFEKLARLLALWQAKLTYWHAIWHVGTFIGTMVLTNEKVALLWHVGLQVRWHINYTVTQVRWHVNHSGTHEHWHGDHAGTEACMARDLANSSESEQATT